MPDYSGSVDALQTCAKFNFVGAILRYRSGEQVQNRDKVLLNFYTAQTIHCERGTSYFTNQQVAIRLPSFIHSQRKNPELFTPSK
jgi:hypothetical protein